MLRLSGPRASLAHAQQKFDAILAEPFFVKYISGKERALLAGCPLGRVVEIVIRVSNVNLSARLGSAPIKRARKREFRDWTMSTQDLNSQGLKNNTGWFSPFKIHVFTFLVRSKTFKNE